LTWLQWTLLDPIGCGAVKWKSDSAARAFWPTMSSHPRGGKRSARRSSHQRHEHVLLVDGTDLAGVRRLQMRYKPLLIMLAAVATAPELRVCDRAADVRHGERESECGVPVLVSHNSADGFDEFVHRYRVSPLAYGDRPLALRTKHNPERRGWSAPSSAWPC